MITKPKRPMPGDFKERALDMPRLGDLIAHYKTSDATVNRWLKEAGISRPRHCRYKMPADFMKVGPAMHIEGLSRHYGVLRKVIKRWLMEAGVEAAPAPNGEYSAKCRPIPHDFNEVAPTMAASALADHYRTGLRTIQRWVSQTGVSPRPYDRTAKHTKSQTRKPARGMVHAMGLSSNITASRMHTVHDIAADTLRRERFPVYRCDERGRADIAGKFWRVGMTVLDDDQLLAKAARYERKAA